MPPIGDPPPTVDRQERTVHGALAPLSYVPVPLLRDTGINASNAGTFRKGSRQAAETRPCRIRAGTIPNAAGSSYVEQGNTKIIASIFGPRQAGERAQKENVSEGTLLVELHFAPFCSRTSSKEENEKRAILYSSMLLRTLESIVLLDRYQKTAFDINLLVLEDDGAVLSASLAAASLALADANVEMRDLAAGATVHILGGEAAGERSGMLLLDCDGDEERAMPAGSAVLHLGMCTSRGVVCMLHSAGPLLAEPFEQSVLLAKDTAEAIGAKMRRCLERSVERRAAKRARVEGTMASGLHGVEVAAPFAVMEDGYG